MAISDGFCSYVHDDDKADHGRITQLANDIAEQYKMITGETLTLFLDKNKIELGDDWQEKIYSDLASTAFFIPIITPRYLMSSECRREFHFFANSAAKLGVEELILSLHYVNIPALEEESPEDDLIELIKKYQWKDWRNLRFSEVTSEEYRRGVFELVERLANANMRVERKNATSSENLTSQNDLDEVSDIEPGILDRLAIMEETLPKWTSTIESITKDIQSIGNIINKAHSGIKRGINQGKGFVARQSVMRITAKKLKDPAERIMASSNTYVSQIHDVDLGVRTIIDQSKIEVEQNPEIKNEICTFFNSIRSLTESTQYAIVSIQSMIDASTPLEKISRDLRPVMRQMRKGLTIMGEASEVSQEWVHLMDSSGIVCD